ncbi:MAG: hypothetical protein WBV94_08660 [Blastocatellia bacterium]
MIYKALSRFSLNLLIVGLFLTIMVAPISAQDRQNSRVDKIAQNQALIESISEKIVSPPVEGRLDPGTIKVDTRSPIAFKPFEMRDPATGNSLPPETILTLPNGNKLTAREYYSQLNSLEQQFNKIGYTLRGGTPSNDAGMVERMMTANGPLDMINLQRVVADESTLRNQTQKISAGHISFNQRSMQLITTETLKESQVANLKDYSARLNPFHGFFPPVSKTTVNETRSWNHTVGNPSTFAAYINGKITLTANASVQDIVGEANAGGSIFNNSKDIIRATGSTHAPANGQDMTTKLNVNILGTTVLNLDKHFASTTVNPIWTESGAITPKPVDFSTTIHFSLGFIPMSVKVGVQGSAKLSYFLSVFPTSVQAQAVPHVESNAYVQAGADIVVASAGAGASMVLLNDDLTLNGELAIKFDDPVKGPYFSAKYSGFNDMEMLSGRVYAYACVKVLTTTWGGWHNLIPHFSWEDKCYNSDLFKWTGFKINGYLFNEQKKFYLF